MSEAGCSIDGMSRRRRGFAVMKYKSIRRRSFSRESVPTREIPRHRHHPVVATSVDKMPLGGSTGSKDTSELAEYWLKRCVDDHSECSEPIGKEGIISTRLIAVNLVGGEMTIRLQTFNNNSP